MVLFGYITKTHSHTSFAYTNTENTIKIQYVNDHEIEGNPQKTKGFLSSGT